MVKVRKRGDRRQTAIVDRSDVTFGTPGFDVIRYAGVVFDRIAFSGQRSAVSFEF